MKLSPVLVLVASAIATADPKAWELEQGLAQLKHAGAKIASLVGAKVAEADPEDQIQKLVDTLNEVGYTPWMKERSTLPG